MKTTIIAATVAAFAACVSVSAAIASPVSDIRDNAAAAASNAHIYQWKRVQLEVVRIADAEKKVQAAQSVKSETLSSAVRELRAAQFAHDADRTEAAAAQVLAATDALSK
ncbi:hypothetical protein CCAX7_30700 [Capsulimonas corticalis]|uniref:Uncharacterized protein n=1 Tax=Capsulimonas corticalis TaxID=2219043 RepID=A0A402CSN9_9BACT|nr:hypothetical protein [Capsulimonas corticalis]BDI31019.1 hypothetical protein CCAX7_30700 [Capsulimonas corticalis]